MGQTRLSALLLAGLLSLIWTFEGALPAAAQEPLVKIEILSVSPRTVARSTTDIYDEVASGLRAVGVGTRVYLQAEPLEGATVGGYQWAITLKPTGSATALVNTTDASLITFRPDVVGVYEVTVTPLDNNAQPTPSVTQRIYAARYIGAGTFNTHEEPDPRAPNCATSWCHGENAGTERQKVVDEWLKSAHAKKLQKHLSGTAGGHYATSCLECHTVGFDTNPAAVNGGFDDVANSINYDLNQIPQLVEDAANTGLDQFYRLPAELQNLASVQCESCHGAGSLHPAYASEPDRGIGGPDLSEKRCAQCHDSASGFQQIFYQWSNSPHPLTASLGEGHVAESASCLKCHTGEGFVDVRVKGLAPTVIPDPHPITCPTCHDPHYSENPFQLRIVGDFTLDSGQTFTNAGLGGLCMRCHNSRVSNPQTTSTGSFRGSHYGPQTDMLLGVNAIDFGLPITVVSAHREFVEDACVHCHMAPPSQAGSGVTEPPKVGFHTYMMRDDMGTPDDQSDDEINSKNACSSCHSELDSTYDRPASGDYDGDGVVEGIQSEVRGLFDLLRPQILATMAGTSIHTEEGPAKGKIDITSASFAALSTSQKQALYNYNFVWLDGSFGVHNSSYAIQILQRSYEPIFGQPIDVDYPSITLRGPVSAQDVINSSGALASIEVKGVSPRDIARDANDVFDEVASGLHNVGIGNKVYLEAEVNEGATVNGYDWAILAKPAGSALAVTTTTDPALITLRLDVGGKYDIILTPLDAGSQPTTPVVQRLYAANWAGAGVFNTHETPAPRIPNCATSFCHGDNAGDERLRIASEWVQSKHANKLQAHLSGERGSHYSTSCLQCHTVGFNTNPASVNAGFDDAANDISYDLNQIPTLVHDAATSGIDGWPLLPAELQAKASVQCENCHGAGALHPQNLDQPDKGIDGPGLDPKRCAQCHDSASGFQQIYYQWSSSDHPVTQDLGEGHVAETASCVKCHTGEGFVSVRINGEPAAPVHNANGITCAACHDPHFSDYEHQLRIAGDFTLDSGQTFTNAGLGGLCMRCHNSRVSSASTSTSSFRGAHYGPQTDMLLGVNGVDFGQTFAPSSPHNRMVEDTCVHCHMADPPQSGPGIIEPPKVGFHTYSMRDNMGTEDSSDDVLNAANACGSCHGGMTTYDRAARGNYDGDGSIEGIQSEVRGLFDILRPLILSTMPGTSITVSEGPSNGRISISSTDFAKLTSNQKQALYDYNFVWSDASFGVHNTAYAVQLLQFSYAPITGRAIEQDYPQITLRALQQPVETGTYWFIY